MSKITRVLSLGGALSVMAVMLLPGHAQTKKKPDKPAPAPVSYTKQVKPLFDKYCLGCHSEQLKQGQFIIATYETLIKGGENGPSLVPGKSAESNLFKALIGKELTKMPPKGALGPVPKELELIKLWIDQGAKDDTPKPDPAKTDPPKEGEKK